MHHTRRIIARNLRKLIEAEGYKSIELFAHENGFEKSWVHKILHGQIDPSIGRVIRLAKALETDLNSIYPGRSKP